MDPVVVGEFGVEGEREDASLADRDRMFIQLTEDLDSGSGPFDPWRPDENAREGVPRSKTGKIQLGLETGSLPAEGISPDSDIE